MPRVTITLADDGAGVSASIAMDTDFDVKSNAHQVANLLMKHLDTLMNPVEDVEEKPSIASQLLVVDR